MSEAQIAFATILSGALGALEDHQEQIDHEGIMVGVSREAVDIVCRFARNAQEEIGRTEALRVEQQVAAGREIYRLMEERDTFRARIKDLESAQGARVPEGEAIQQIKNRLDIRLNNRLCEMKEGWDDSVVGFNDAWDIMRVVFADLAAAPPAPSAPSREPMTEAELKAALGRALGVNDVYDLPLPVPAILTAMRAVERRALTEVSRIGGIVVTDEMVERALRAWAKLYVSGDPETTMPALRAALHAALGQEKA